MHDSNNRKIFVLILLGIHSIFLAGISNSLFFLFVNQSGEILSYTQLVVFSIVYFFIFSFCYRVILKTVSKKRKNTCKTVLTAILLLLAYPVFVVTILLNGFSYLGCGQEFTEQFLDLDVSVCLPPIPENINTFIEPKGREACISPNGDTIKTFADSRYTESCIRSMAAFAKDARLCEHLKTFTGPGQEAYYSGCVEVAS